MDNFEKTNKMSLPDLQAEVAKLRADTQANIEKINTNVLTAANAAVESNEQSFAELEYKKYWEACLPGLGIPRPPVNQVPPEQLEELLQLKALTETGLSRYSDSIQQLFDESVNTKWVDINSARNDATQLRQRHLRNLAEEEKVLSAIEKDRQNAVAERKKLADLIEDMKKLKIRQKARQTELNQETKMLDGEIDHLIGELNVLKSRASTNEPTDEKKD